MIASRKRADAQLDAGKVEAFAGAQHSSNDHRTAYILSDHFNNLKLDETVVEK